MNKLFQTDISTDYYPLYWKRNYHFVCDISIFISTFAAIKQTNLFYYLISKGSLCSIT